MSSEWGRVMSWRSGQAYALLARARGDFDGAVEIDELARWHFARVSRHPPLGFGAEPLSQRTRAESVPAHVAMAAVDMATDGMGLGAEDAGPLPDDFSF